MNEENKSSADLTDLRRKAELAVKNRPLNANMQFSETEALKMIYELEVHQIELEMQNEELVQAKKKAEEASEKYTDLYDFAPSGYFTLSDEGDILETNLLGAAMLGKERSRLLYNRFGLFVSACTQPIFFRFLENVFTSHKSESCEVTLAAGQNPPMHVQLTGRINKNKVQCLLVVSDITDRKKAEDVIRESEQFLKDTQMIARLGTFSQDLVSGRWQGSEVLNLIYGIDSDFDKSTEGLMSIVHPEWQKTMFDYFLNEVIGKKQNFDKIFKIKRKNDQAERWIHGRGRLEFNADHEPLRMVGTISDITERKLAEEALKESEARFRNVLQNVQAISVQGYGPDGTTQYWNKASETLYGYTEQEAVGQNLLDLIIPTEMRMEVGQAIQYMAETGQSIPASELSLMRKDGSRVSVFSSHTLIKVPGHPQELFCIDIDLTDRKQAEQALIESELKYRELIENSPDAIVIYVEGTIVLVNHECLRLMSSADPTELIGKTILQFVHPDQRQRASKRMIRATTEGIVLPLSVITLVRADGSEVEVEVKAMPVRFSNKPAMQLIIRDITERLQAEKSLLESRELLNKTEEIAHLGSWELNLKTGQLIWSDEVYRIFGLSPHEFAATHTAFIESVHPEDRDLLNSAYFTSVAENKAGYSIEHRIILPHSGEIRHVYEKCEHIRDASGKIVRSVGMVHDITERKRIEEALKQSEAHYRLLTEDVADVVWKLDNQNHITYISPADERLRGYKAEDTIGKHVSDMLTDEGIALVKKMMQFRSTAEQNGTRLGTLNYEVQQRCSDGSLIWTEISATAEYDRQGLINGYHGISRDISERKQTDEALRKSEELYRFMFANNPQPMFIYDPETLDFLEVNKAAIYHYGYSETEFRDMHLTDIRPKEDIPALLEEIKHHRQHHKPPGIWRHLKKNGELLYVQIASHSLNYNGRHARHVLINDLTERRMAEKELEESEKKFRELFEANSDGIIIFIIGDNGMPSNIMDLNENAAKMVGYGKDEMRKMPLDRLEKDITTEKIGKRKQDLVTKGFSTFETIVNHKDGHEINVEIKVIVINYQNQFGLMNIVRDITERKNTEIQLNKYAGELSKQNAEKDKFFSIIAHDLRSPFNVFLGFTQMMEEDLPTLSMHEIQNIAGNMRKSATKLFNLLENLLEWSSIQRGIINFHPEKLNVQMAIASIIEVVHETSIKKLITLTLDVPENLIIFADKQMFESLIRNLVFNAVKFTPRGGKILVSAKAIPGNAVEISIKDTGIGMNNDILAKLFHLSEQPHRYGTEGEPSTGLGLIICKDFIEKHGGKIWAESTEGSGSTFYLNIPCRTEELAG